MKTLPDNYVHCTLPLEDLKANRKVIAVYDSVMSPFVVAVHGFSDVRTFRGTVIDAANGPHNVDDYKSNWLARVFTLYVYNEPIEIELIL
jgi:hypothetical protein